MLAIASNWVLSIRGIGPGAEYQNMRHSRWTGRTSSLSSPMRMQANRLALVLFAGLLSMPAAFADDPMAALQNDYQKNPSDSAAAKKLGRAYLEQNKYAEATKVFEALADKTPGDAEAHFLLGEALLRNEKFVEASIELKRAATVDPTKPTYMVHAGEALLSAKRFDDLTEYVNNNMAKCTDDQTKKCMEWLLQQAQSRGPKEPAKVGKSRS